MSDAMRRSISIWAGTVLVLLAMMAPLGVNEYYQSFLLQVFLVIALAQAWNLISGMTGYVSFGHAAFFGVGAYAGALLLTWGFPWWAAILHGAGIATLLAVPLGFLTLRLRGPYFAIAMLGLNEVGRIVATLWVDVTKGGTGLTLSPTLLPSLDMKYFTMFGLALGATLLVAWVHRSRFGLELRAIREDEEAAEMVGVNTTRNKVDRLRAVGADPGRGRRGLCHVHQLHQPEFGVRPRAQHRDDRGGAVRRQRHGLGADHRRGHGHGAARDAVGAVPGGAPRGAGCAAADRGAVPARRPDIHRA